MDNELEARTESRRIPASLGTSGVNANDDQERETIKGSIDEDAHILNNLIQSMDASGGGSGPVINILKEMEGGG